MTDLEMYIERIREEHSQEIEILKHEVEELKWELECLNNWLGDKLEDFCK